MNSMTELTPSMVMASGRKRISALVDQHGITSPQVWDAIVRWGGILDDVNHPDTTCRNCGEAVTYNSMILNYVHVRDRDKNPTDIPFPSARWCLTKAGAEAAPEVEQAKVRIVKANSLERTRLYDNQARLG